MIYGASARDRGSGNRQLAGIMIGLLVYNGLLCWANTRQHTSLLVLTHLGNYGLLGLGLGVIAQARGDIRNWSSMLVSAAIAASQVHVFIARPELTSFAAGWAFWVTSAVEVVGFVVVVVDGFRSPALEPEPEPLAYDDTYAVVVPLRAPRVTASAEVKRAA